MTADFKLIKQKIVHQWAAWALVQADFSDPTGEKFVRTFVDSPGAVGVVALAGEVGARIARTCVGRHAHGRRPLCPERQGP